MARSRANSDAKLAAADASFQAGSFADAVAAYEQILKREPRRTDVLQRAAMCLGHLGRFDRSADMFRRAAAITPSATLHTNCGVALLHAGRFDAAHRAFDLALRLEPNHPAALARKANLHLMQGDRDKAMTLLEPCATLDAPPAVLADVYGRVSRAVERADEGLAVIRRALASTGEADPTRVDLLFRLAELLDATGEHPAAFTAATEANACRREERGWDAAAHTVRVDRLIESWRPVADAVTSGSEDERAVLIVGMPRSGTSLVEQIIASHPQAYGAGELAALANVEHDLERETNDDIAGSATQAQFHGAARTYLSVLTAGAGKARRVTDKMPGNFLRLGLMMRLLPRADRPLSSDPLDTCLSCFFQNFGVPTPYTNDLDDLGSYYRDYERLMRHWSEGHWSEDRRLSMLDVDYQAMIDDQAGESRRIIEFLGLEWDDACLAFHKSKRVTLTASSDQVQRPVYRSSLDRHAHYADELEPLRAALDRV